MIEAPSSSRRFRFDRVDTIPHWLKIIYTLWFLVWFPSYWSAYGPVNFLWLCDAANILILFGLWAGSPLVLSSQALSVSIIQIAWMIDFSIGFMRGKNPLGCTEYMFDPGIHIGLRVLSLFHVFTPVLLLWLLIAHTGYDRRALKVQTVICWLLLPLGYLFGSVDENINWSRGYLGTSQDAFQPIVYLILCMVLYPILLYYPTHRFLRKLIRPAN